jgi:hypothetical protein
MPTPGIRNALRTPWVMGLMGDWVKLVKTVPIGKRRIQKRGGRYYIELPSDLRELWEYLHSNGVKVNVLIEVVGGEKP